MLVIAGILVDKDYRVALKVLHLNDPRNGHLMIASDREVIEAMNEGKVVVGVHNNTKRYMEAPESLMLTEKTAFASLDKRVYRTIPVINVDSFNQIYTDNSIKYKKEYHKRTAVALERIGEYTWKVYFLHGSGVWGNTIIDGREICPCDIAWNLNCKSNSITGLWIPYIVGLKQAIDRGRSINNKRLKEIIEEKSSQPLEQASEKKDKYLNSMRYKLINSNEHPKSTKTLMLSFSRYSQDKECCNIISKAYSLSEYQYYRYGSEYVQDNELDDYLKNTSNIELMNHLSWSLCGRLEPIMYLVDDINQLKKGNKQWFSRRTGKGDFIVDIKGNLISCDKLGADN